MARKTKTVALTPESEAGLASLKPFDIDRALAERSLYHFVKQAWHIVESVEFADNWHLKFLCDHLEALVRNKINNNLLINVPPGTSKSTLGSVMLPAWTWTWKPAHRFLCACYSAELSIRDSVRCREILESAWYRARWPETAIKEDLNQKIKFENSAGGWRIATTPRGRGLGEHPDTMTRQLDDHYPTPAWVAAALLAELGPVTGCVLDAGAGIGALGQAVEAAAGDAVQVDAVELDAGRAAQLPGHWGVQCGDFLQLDPPHAGGYDLIITNPPFLIWQAFVERCLQLVAPGGRVAALAFSNILGARKRAAWWAAHRPSLILQSSVRPKFRADGDQDQRETLWIVWGPNPSGETIHRWLPLPPPTLRQLPAQRRNP